ncbi:unnamed protein product, partial [Rangifer tarandus platyrhynchus]
METHLSPRVLLPWQPALISPTPGQETGICQRLLLSQPSSCFQKIPGLQSSGHQAAPLATLGHSSSLLPGRLKLLNPTPSNTTPGRFWVTPVSVYIVLTAPWPQGPLTSLPSQSLCQYPLPWARAQHCPVGL